MYPMYQDIWLHDAWFGPGAFVGGGDNIPDFKLPPTEEEIVVENIE